MTKLSAVLLTLGRITSFAIATVAFPAASTWETTILPTLRIALATQLSTAAQETTDALIITAPLLKAIISAALLKPGQKTRLVLA